MVRWFFGYGTDRAVVLTVEEVRAGKTITNRRGIEKDDCEGLVDGYDICGYPYGPVEITGPPEEQERFNWQRVVARDIELISSAAGYIAEAHYRKISPMACLLAGGFGDLNTTREIIDAWNLDEGERNRVSLLAERRAAALVRSPRGSAAIKAMADALMDRGEIDGEEISRHCQEAYGGEEPAFGGWNDHWPPSLADLRAGRIIGYPEKTGSDVRAPEP